MENPDLRLHRPLTPADVGEITVDLLVALEDLEREHAASKKVGSSPEAWISRSRTFRAALQVLAAWDCASSAARKLRAARELGEGGDA